MVELICERESCKYCLYDKCENEQIKKFQNVRLVNKVLISVSSDSNKNLQSVVKIKLIWYYI